MFNLAHLYPKAKLRNFSMAHSDGQVLMGAAACRLVMLDHPQVRKKTGGLQGRGRVGNPMVVMSFFTAWW